MKKRAIKSSQKKSFNVSRFWDLGKRLDRRNNGSKKK